MHRYVLGTLILALAASGGCATRSAEGRPGAVAQSFELLSPPDVPDQHYPGGVHVQTSAPLPEWHRVAMFATLDECETSRAVRINDTIDEARIRVGDEAKNQLPVRRAVNARCVRAR
jgi:hypothetical protein